LTNDAHNHSHYRQHCDGPTRERSLTGIGNRGLTDPVCGLHGFKLHEKGDSENSGNTNKQRGKPFQISVDFLSALDRKT